MTATARTNLDVAADAMGYDLNERTEATAGRTLAKWALDAIHPALAHLTPDDVASIFNVIRTYDEVASFRPSLMTRHAREVLSPVSDLAAEGDRLHAATLQDGADTYEFLIYVWERWPTIAAALRERDATTYNHGCTECAAAVGIDPGRAAGLCVDHADALRARAKTAEAKSDEGWALVDELTEALARANRMMTGEDDAAVEARP